MFNFQIIIYLFLNKHKQTWIWVGKNVGVESGGPNAVRRKEIIIISRA